MTVQKMIDLLGFRVEDTDTRKFNLAMRLDVLHQAQLTVVNLLDNSLLTELQAVESNLTTIVAANGVDAYYALSGLANDIARNGLVAAKVYGASGKYFNIVKYEDVKKGENTYLSGSDDFPVGYIYKNQFFLQTTTAGGVVTIDIWYIKQPSELKYTYTTDSVANGAASGSYAYSIDLTVDTLTPLSSTTNDTYNGAVVYNKTKAFYAVVYDYVGATKVLHVIYDINEATEWEASDEFYFVAGPSSNQRLGDYECELNDSLHMLVVDFAEAELLKMVNDVSRSDKAIEKALSQINALNARAGVEGAAGIGTSAQGG